MDEAELEHRQGAKLYPVGRALRATYDADNHDTLGRDVTGLMLDLSRVPTEEAVPPLFPGHAAHAPADAGTGVAPGTEGAASAGPGWRGWFGRVARTPSGWFGRGGA